MADDNTDDDDAPERHLYLTDERGLTRLGASVDDAAGGRLLRLSVGGHHVTLGARETGRLLTLLAWHFPPVRLRGGRLPQPGTVPPASAGTVAADQAVVAFDAATHRLEVALSVVGGPAEPGRRFAEAGRLLGVALDRVAGGEAAGEVADREGRRRVRWAVRPRRRQPAGEGGRSG